MIYINGTVPWNIHQPHGFLCVFRCIRLGLEEGALELNSMQMCHATLLIRSGARTIILCAGLTSRESTSPGVTFLVGVTFDFRCGETRETVMIEIEFYKKSV